MEAIDKLQTLMETLSGINSVVRGDPLPQLKSGAALALVQSLAVAFNTNSNRPWSRTTRAWRAIAS